MNDCVERYKKELNKRLSCSKNVRKRLVDQFEGALEGFLEDNNSPSAEDMNLAFGSPAEMAQTLMESVTQEEKHQYQRLGRIKRILAGIVLGAFLLLTVYIYFYKETSMNYSDEIVPEDTHLEETNTTVEGDNSK